MDGLLRTQIIGGPVPIVLLVLSGVLALVLLVRRPTRRWILTAGIAIVVGAAIGLAVFTYVNAARTFEIVLPRMVGVWVCLTLAGVGLAVANLWRSRWWRKLLAVVAMIVFAATGTVQVNAVFDLNPSLADLLGVTVKDPIAIPTTAPTPDPTASDLPLYETWVPPKDMPDTGRIGTVNIPATVSGFHARPAGLYLPPAALVKNAPRLPLLIMMMGYPGNPDPTRISEVMNDFAAAHHGLAPIVVVADQIGPGHDPACADSKARGNAATYIKTDVLRWATSHLNVGQSPSDWVLAGYSNGAACAVKYAAQEPATFQNVLSVSPELFPGMDYSASVIQTVYAGNRAAWAADKPAAILAAHHGDPAYANVHAIITTGALDKQFGPATRDLAAAAKDAGMDVTLLTIPGVTHIGANVVDALTAGFAKMAPSLGLAAP